MTRRRLLVLAAVALAVLLLAASIALPLLLQVERHRGRIEQALAETTGWNAELGELSLSFRGGVSVKAAPVRLSAPDGDSSIEVGAITIGADVLPLFRGDLNVRRVDVVEPKIVLVRPDAGRGWVIPLLSAEESPAGEKPGAGGFALSVGRVSATRGEVRFEDRSVAPPRVFTLEEVDFEIEPETLAFAGSAAIPGGDGRLTWSGEPDGPATLTLQSVTTDSVGAWLGTDALGGGGSLEGEVTVDLPAAVAGRISVQRLRLSGGDQPLERAEVEFMLAAAGTGWNVDRLEMRSGQARVVGSGTLVPDLDLELVLGATPLEDVLRLSRTLLVQPLSLEPPGSAELTLHVRQPADGELTYEAEGALSAARFLPGGVLPPVSDLRTTFRLGREGALALDIAGGRIGGGPLEGRLEIDSVDPLGTMEFEGRLSGASFGALLGGVIAGAPERISGPTAVDAHILLDLGSSSPGAADLGGTISLSTEQVSVSGWGLEAALRGKFREELGKLADVAGLIDADLARRLAAEPDDEPNRLLDRIVSEVRLDGLPWRLERFEMSSGGVSAAGQGSFDPISGRLELRCEARLDPALTRSYVERLPLLESLVRKGRLVLPLEVRGTPISPEVGMDLTGLVSDSLRDETVKGLLDKLFD